MACTRFYYDDCRTKKRLQQSTDPGRWILNVPGNSDTPSFIEDPQIIMQKWGANLRTNSINLESDLFRVNRPLSRDCLGKDNYQTFAVPNYEIQYPSNNNTFTDQSRTTHPAWWYRDVDRINLDFPFLNPQENTFLHFQNYLNTRVLEKDNFTPKRDCITHESKNYMPISYNLIRGSYVGGPITCQQTNSCDSVNNT